MKILVTGSEGFVGKNLTAELRNRKYMDILEYDRDTDPGLLDEYARECGFVFHLAGVNRPQNQEEFMAGNFGLTSSLLELLKKHGNKAPVMISSSIHAELDNPYGQSKKAGEDLMFAYAGETGAKVLVYRFPNIFGKWAMPNYNSAVATFCHNTARSLPIQVNDPDAPLRLVYIDDVVEELLNALEGRENRAGGFCAVPVSYSVTVGLVADLIRSFGETRKSLGVPFMANELEKKLYSTYLSYLPPESLSYSLKMNVDNRGSFTEIIRTPDRGQFSVNIAKPGITKGNHWHHSKNEKFLVVSGKGLIKLRKVGTEEVHEYYVSGEKMEVVDIPTGYTHNITNIGEEDLVTFMWVNEAFDPAKADTYFLEV